MLDIIRTIPVIGIIGLLTEWLGLFFGGIASLVIKQKGIRIKGAVLGFLGGLTLGIVFFDLLPEAIAYGNIYLSITGAVLGLCLAVLVDGKLEGQEVNEENGIKSNFLKTATFMAIGISIHNMPSGLALGSLFFHNPIDGLYLTFALIIHGIPEGLTLGVLFRESIQSRLKLFVISIMISIPMGVGALLGCVLSSPLLICASLSFAAAMVLYVTLRETLPTANDLWKGRLTTIGNVLGIILGMLFVSMLDI